MANPYALSLVAGALSKAVGQAYGGYNEGVQLAEERRQKQAKEAREQAQLALDQAREARLGKFTEAEIGQMNRPRTYTVNGALVQEQSGGGFTERYRAPETPQTRLSWLQLGDYEKTKQADEDLAAFFRQKATDPRLSDRERIIYRTAANDRNVRAKIAEDWAKTPKAPTSAVGLQLSINDPATDPAVRRQYQKVLSADEARQTRIAKARGEATQEVKSDPLLGEHSAKWSNTFGERPSPMLRMSEAVARGYRPDTKTSPADARRMALASIKQIEAVLPSLEKKGLLMGGQSILSEWAAAGQRRLMKPGDPDLAKFLSHAGTMVSMQRQLGDIGPRALAAYDSAINIIKHPTTAAAISGALRQIRDLLLVNSGYRVFLVKDTQGRSGSIAFAPGEEVAMPPGVTAIEELGR